MFKKKANRQIQSNNSKQMYSFDVRDIVGQYYIKHAEWGHLAFQTQQVRTKPMSRSQHKGFISLIFL